MPECVPVRGAERGLREMINPMYVINAVLNALVASQLFLAITFVRLTAVRLRAVIIGGRVVV